MPHREAHGRDAPKRCSNFLGASSRPRYGGQRGLWYGCWSNSFIHKRPFFTNTFAKLSQTPPLSFAEPMLGNNASDEDSFITCQTALENHGSLLDSLVNMQLASGNPFSGQIVADYVFFGKVYWITPSKCTLTFARSFAKLSRNFRKNIPIHRPQPSAGGASKKSKHQGPWRLALAKPHFWKLGCCIWSLFLETPKRIIRQWQRQVQGCASGPWVANPHLWKLGCYLWRGRWLSKNTTQGTEPEPNRNSSVPFSCRTPGGRGWQPFTSYIQWW